MWHLLRYVHFSFWKHSPLQALLPVAGIALGVAAIVSIDLGTGSTVASFRRTMEQLEGKTTHQIHPGPRGLDGRWAQQLRKIEEVKAAAPVVESVLLSHEALQLYGVDPFSEAGIRELGMQEVLGNESAANHNIMRFISEPGALIVSQPFMSRHDLQEGDTFEVISGDRRRTVHVLAALPTKLRGMNIPDNLAICDIATAQEILGHEQVSRIDLVIEGNATTALRKIQELLPAGTKIQKPGGRTAYLDTMLSALQTNLGALSYLALFVALFLIYNSMVLAVLRRRADLGIVRCLGATRREVLGAWLLEGAAIGIVGSLIGITFGIAAGQLALQGISRTASDLYGYVHADALTLMPFTFVKAISIGVAASLTATFLPATEAARTLPVRSSSRAESEENSQDQTRKLFFGAIPLLLITLVSILIPSKNPVFGYVAAISLALAVALIIPRLSYILFGHVEKLMEKSSKVLGAMSASNIRNSLSRTGIALAALTIALSMSIAMGTMIGSFRHELHSWIADSVQADIYISPASSEVDRQGARLNSQLKELLAKDSRVEAIDSYPVLPALVKGIETFSAGIEMSVWRLRAEPELIQGPRDRIMFFDRLEAGQAAISETLMRKTGYKTGDEIDVYAGGNKATFLIAGVYRDYSSDRGVVLMDKSTWQTAFGVHAPNSLALYLSDNTRIDPFVSELKKDLSSEYALLIRSNRSLRQQAYDVFDRTFSVARSLEIIGIAVAAIGILSALLALLLERRREIATLRALGMTRRQLGQLLMGESIMMAIMAWVLALFTGTALAWILLSIINLRSFGWKLPMEFPFESWAWMLFWSLGAAILATLLPMKMSQDIPLAQHLRDQ